MRTYGRIGQVNGVGGTWVEISTDANGNSEYVLITTLIQVLKLVLGESPFYANYGIPAQRSVIQQIFPDFYVNITQQQFAPFFASLLISKVPAETPIYNVSLMTTQGTKFQVDIAT